MRGRVRAAAGEMRAAALRRQPPQAADDVWRGALEAGTRVGGRRQQRQSMGDEVDEARNGGPRRVRPEFGRSKQLAKCGWRGRGTFASSGGRRGWSSILQQTDGTATSKGGATLTSSIAEPLLADLHSSRRPWRGSRPPGSRPSDEVRFHRDIIGK